jgi:hypothetical protein
MLSQTVWLFRLEVLDRYPLKRHTGESEFFEICGMFLECSITIDLWMREMHLNS